MIKIERGKCPEVLIDTPLDGTHYNKPSVVDALWKMQNEKCCYCEQLISEAGHLKAVEHFKPQSIFRSKRNDWNNLLLACPQCNGKKSNLFPVKITTEGGETKVIFLNKTDEIPKHSSLLINPCIVDPEDHIDYEIDLDDSDEFFGRIKPKNLDEKGKYTIEVTGLDSTFNTKKRFTHYVNVLMLEYRNLLIAKQNGPGPALDRQKVSFRNQMSASREFAGYVRAYARHKNLDTKFGIEIPRGSEK